MAYEQGGQGPLKKEALISSTELSYSHGVLFGWLSGYKISFTCCSWLIKMPMPSGLPYLRKPALLVLLLLSNRTSTS